LPAWRAFAPTGSSAATCWAKTSRKTDPKILQETYDFWLKVFPRVPNPGPEDATVFLDFMQVKEQRDWRDFVDTSVMDELQREGFLNSVYK